MSGHWQKLLRTNCSHFQKVVKEQYTENSSFQKHPSRGVLRKRCSENIQQIYRRTPMRKCDFNKVARQFFEITLSHGCSPVNLLYILQTHPDDCFCWFNPQQFQSCDIIYTEDLKIFPTKWYEELQKWFLEAINTGKLNF